MNKFRKFNKEYYIGSEKVLFNPLIRWKNGTVTNDQLWWVGFGEVIDMLEKEDWWSMEILVALPSNSMGAVTISDNTWQMKDKPSCEWTLKKGFTVRDKAGKLIGFSKELDDAAKDREHMYLLFVQRIEEIMNGKADYVN